MAVESEIRKTLADLKLALEKLLAGREKEILLYGSRARGDFTEDSDTDVAVIVDGLYPALKDQILEEVARVELEHLRPLSVLVLDKEEFNKLYRRERRIALDIRREGVAL
jgi:predicted nucleotidyltransferase